MHLRELKKGIFVSTLFMTILTMNAYGVMRRASGRHDYINDHHSKYCQEESAARRRKSQKGSAANDHLI
jgi:hypothetical protein